MRLRRDKALRRRSKRAFSPAEDTHRVPKIGYYRSSDSRRDRGVDSVYQQKMKEESNSNVAKRVKGFFRVLIKNISFVAIILIVLINTTIAGVSVQVSGSDSVAYRELQEYNGGLQSIINESLLYKSKFSLSSSKVESRLKELFPEIVDASVVVPLAGRKLQAQITLDSPLVRLSRQNRQQGIVGESGKLLNLTDTQTILERFSSLPSLAIDPNVDFQQGSQVLTSIEVSLVSLLLAEFDGSEAYRPKVSSIEFKVDKREMLVRFSDATYYAVITPESDVRPQVGALIATLKQLLLEGSAPQEYIDARVVERVFVK